MAMDMEKRVENAAKGITPTTKPDERRRYLGSLRERTYLRMTIAQAKDLELQKELLNHIQDFKPYTVLINGKMPQTNFINKLMTECSKYNIPFTLISDDTAQTAPDSTGILIVAKTAINQMRIEINQVYAPELPKVALDKTKHKSFWQKLFGK